LPSSAKRSCQKFLSQPFFVAQQFTGREGKYVPLSDTVRGFGEILDGKHDELPEDAFYMCGGIDEVVEKARGMMDQEAGERKQSTQQAPEAGQATAPAGEETRAAEAQAEASNGDEPGKAGAPVAGEGGAEPEGTDTSS
jgi:hypothetical protein